MLAAHPALQVNLIGDNRDLSFTRREADLAIRLNRPNEDAALRMRKVGELGFAVYGTGDLRGIRRANNGRMCHGLPIRWSSRACRRCSWLTTLEPRQLVRMSSVSMMLRAAKQGRGPALLPCIVAESVGLQRVEPQPVLRRELWLLSHRDAGQVTRFRAVADWLGQLFEVDAGALRGDAATP